MRLHFESMWVFGVCVCLGVCPQRILCVVGGAVTAAEGGRGADCSLADKGGFTLET